MVSIVMVVVVIVVVCVVILIIIYIIKMIVGIKSRLDGCSEDITIELYMRFTFALTLMMNAMVKLIVVVAVVILIYSFLGQELELFVLPMQVSSLLLFGVYWSL